MFKNLSFIYVFAVVLIIVVICCLMLDKVGKKTGNIHISQDGGKYW